MTPPDYLRQELADASAEVAATLPPDGTAALLALLRAGDRGEPAALAGDPAPVARPGWNLALRLCLDRLDDGDAAPSTDPTALATWAGRFLDECDQAALAGLALAQCAAGHLQVQRRAPRRYAAWPTSRFLSPEQQERADVDWWAAHVARQAAPDLAALLAERESMQALLRGDAHDDSCFPASAGDRVADASIDTYYRRLGHAYAARFSYQHSYPADAMIGGTTFRRYTDLLALLIGWLHREHDRRVPDEDDAPVLWDEKALLAALAAALDADPAEAERMLQPFMLDRANAAYHSALPGVAPPLIRLDAGRVAASTRGLLGEPLLFLARELRRRHAQEYHNSAHLREGAFRQDLYRLFADRRFVRSAGRVELKRAGAARTDLDALIFDRKTGTLGIFELKAQDPFARSVEERQRQRDNFLQANRQVAAILEWAQRYGPDDLLARVDASAARRVHVRKVHAFVLGRYLAHVSSGAAPDRRAAWGSWPRVLRVATAGALDAAQRNPLGALFARLRDVPAPSAPAESQEIAVGGLRLRVFPSFAAMRADEQRSQ